MSQRSLLAEPYKIKVVESIRQLPRPLLKKAIKKAGYNTFLLRSEDVYIDLLTDSGTNAMSDNQWAGMMLGDEAYAGSKNFYNFEQAVREIYGYKYVVPTHQGRAAEHILAQNLVKPGQLVPMNMYFTTTRQHIELADGHFVDIIIDEGHKPESNHPFKGNIDLDKLNRLLKKEGKKKIAYLWLAPCVNMAGGQPFSLTNLIKVRAWSKKHQIPIYLDATRAAENCYFIKVRERGYKNTPVRKILKEMCSLTDGCTMSAKKDPMLNIGGFIATNSKKLFTAFKAMVVVYEGLHTYGGLAGRDLEAMARGIYEMVDDDHIANRVAQVEYLGNRLLEAKVPIVTPIGGHAVFLNAKKILPDLPHDKFPAQALTAAVYMDAGVRSMERGIVSAGRDPKTGDHRKPKLELVRLAIPRRVYTNSHMDVVASSVINLYRNRNDFEILRKGLEFVYEPKKLRFFQAHFKIGD